MSPISYGAGFELDFFACNRVSSLQHPVPVQRQQSGFRGGRLAADKLTKWYPGPAASKANPRGPFKLAAVAGPPSPLYPAVPLPATVVMILLLSTLRTRLLPRARSSTRIPRVTWQETSTCNATQLLRRLVLLDVDFHVVPPYKRCASFLTGSPQTQPTVIYSIAVLQ